MSFPRYPKYKDSGVEWLGDVPEHWLIAPLKRMLTIQNGADHKDFESDEGYPVIGSGGPFAYASRYLYDGESVLLGRKGTIDCPLYVTGKFWTVDTMYWTKIAPDTHGRFAYYAALGIPFDFYSTNTALPSMTKGVLASHVLACPPYREQAAIAAFLDRETAKIDALIAEQQRLIELLQEKRQAVISHAVTKGLNPHAPMKDSGIEWLGEVPEHWEVCRVKAVSSFTTSGPRGWSARVGDEGALFVQSGDLTDVMGVDFANCKRVQVADDAETARTRLQDGDVVVCVTGAKTGNVAVCETVPEASYVNQHVCLVRPNERVHPRFLATLLKSGCGQTYFSLAQYGLKQGLSLEDVRDAPVILPPLDEQRSIIEVTEGHGSAYLSLQVEAQRAITLLQERRSALISAAVTGQIDVRGLAGSEAA